MYFEDSIENLEILVVKSADIINKPFIHSVVKVSEQNSESSNVDVVLNILCRDPEGNRLKRYDLELEIFSFKNEFTFVISKLHYPNEPMLWSGNKNLWLDSNTGKRCEPPNYHFRLENLASKIKSLVT